MASAMSAQPAETLQFEGLVADNVGLDSFLDMFCIAKLGAIPLGATADEVGMCCPDDLI